MRGGRRTGAGRPASDLGVRVPLCVKVPMSTVEFIKQVAIEKNVSQGEVVQAAIALLKKTMNR